MVFDMICISTVKCVSLKNDLIQFGFLHTGRKVFLFSKISAVFEKEIFNSGTRCAHRRIQIIPTQEKDFHLIFTGSLKKVFHRLELSSK